MIFIVKSLLCNLNESHLIADVLTFSLLEHVCQSELKQRWPGHRCCLAQFPIHQSQATLKTSLFSITLSHTWAAATWPAMGVAGKTDAKKCEQIPVYCVVSSK